MPPRMHPDALDLCKVLQWRRVVFDVHFIHANAMAKMCSAGQKQTDQNRPLDNFPGQRSDAFSRCFDEVFPHFRPFV